MTAQELAQQILDIAQQALAQENRVPVYLDEVPDIGFARAGLEAIDMLLYAKQQADREFDHYFPKIHPYITRIEAVILREIYLAEGYVGYLIRVYVTCPLEIVQEFHKASGIYVDIPPEQITYRYDSEADKKSWLESLKEGIT